MRTFTRASRRIVCGLLKPKSARTIVRGCHSNTAGRGKLGSAIIAGGATTLVALTIRAVQAHGHDEKLVKDPNTPHRKKFNALTPKKFYSTRVFKDWKKPESAAGCSDTIVPTIHVILAWPSRKFIALGSDVCTRKGPINTHYETKTRGIFGDWKVIEHLQTDPAIVNLKYPKYLWRRIKYAMEKGKIRIASDRIFSDCIFGGPFRQREERSLSERLSQWHAKLSNKQLSQLLAVYNTTPEFTKSLSPETIDAIEKNLNSIFTHHSELGEDTRQDTYFAQRYLNYHSQPGDDFGIKPPVVTKKIPHYMQFEKLLEAKADELREIASAQLAFLVAGIDDAKFDDEGYNHYQLRFIYLVLVFTHAELMCVRDSDYLKGSTRPSKHDVVIDSLSYF